MEAPSGSIELNQPSVSQVDEEGAFHSWRHRISSLFLRLLPVLVLIGAALLFSRVASAQNLYVGSNSSGNITNFTSGTNSYSNTYVGYTTNATNNLLDVSGAGTLLTNTIDIYIGYFGSGNRLLISNGAQVANRFAYLGYGMRVEPWLYATNNSALVTGTNSRWTVSGLDVGFQGNASSLVISNGGQVSSYYAVRIGPYASGNSVLVSGTGSTLLASVKLGESSTEGLSYNNSLIVSNGGVITGTNAAVTGGSYIGYSSSNNSVLVTGSGSVWTESGALQIGLFQNGTGNRLVISNGGTVTSASGIIGVGGYTWYDPLPGNAGNRVLVTGTNSLWTSTGQLIVGQNSDGNSLTISDGGSVVCGANLTINQYYPNTNYNYAGSLVLVQSGRLVVTNGQINFGPGLGTLQVDGGTVEVKQLLATNPITPSGQILPAERRGSYVLLNGGSIISESTTIYNESGKSDNRTFYIGGNTGSGAAFIAKGGTHNFWANMAVGDSGSSNSLVITNGAEVFLQSRPDPNHGPSGGTNLVIGVAAGASNNSVSISSGRLVMTNGTIEVGRSGSGSLNVSGGGIVAASNIVIAASNGSSGTLNIGRFGTNDAAGMISATTIAFGTGTGAINFNQSNAVTITNVISGNGTVNQLGAGTSTLSGVNTYGGVTTVGGGVLRVTNLANAGTSSAIGTNATISLTNCGVLDYAGATNTSMNRGINLAAGNGGIGVSNSAVALTISGVISNTGGLVKSGAGTLILAASNTYTGGTTISAGTLQINTGGAVSNSATTLIGSGGSGALNITGGTYSNNNVYVGYGGGTGILNLSSGSLSAQTLAIGGNGSSAGTLNLNGGTVAVSGSFYVASGGTINVNTGGVLRGGNGGQLWVDQTNSLVNFNGGSGSSGLNLFVGNGGTVDLRGQSLGTNNWGNLIASAPGGVLRNSGTNAATIATANTIWLWQGGQKLTINASSGDILINSWITSSQMTNTGIIKTGTNALVLTYSGNDYNGGTDLQQGTLRLDHARAAGSGAITQSDAGSTLQINATGTVSNAMSLYNIATLQTVTLSGNKTLNGTTYNVATETTTIDSGVLSGAGGLTKSGAGTLTLSAVNTYSGGTRVIGGTLALGATNTLADAGAVTVTGSGSVLTNSTNQFVGNLSSSNSMTISNGGKVANGQGSIGYTSFSSNNSALVTGANSLWTNSQNLRVGYEGRGNSLVISNGGKVVNVEGSIGYTGFSSNNSAVVTGANSVWTNSGYLYVGAYGSSNSLVVSNGGTVAALISQIGTFGSSFNNSVLVTGTNSLFNNALYLFIGGPGNSGNSMVISNGGLVTVGIHSYIGGDVPASNNSVLVTGAGSRLTNAFSLFVGQGGNSNSLVITSSGEVFVGQNLMISSLAGASNNSVSIDSGRLVVTNGEINIGAGGSASLRVNGGTVEVNTLTATNGTNSVITLNGGTIVSSGTAVTNGSDFIVGDTGSGATFIAKSGSHNFSANMVVGNSGSSNNLIITNGSTVTSVKGWIGYNAGSSNNSVLVTGTNSLWTNSDALTIGKQGTSSSLTVAAGGTVAATNIVLGSQSASSGTLNIGRYGSNDTAGTINSPTIAFGAGTGAINFNQRDAFALASAISGSGSVNQLGNGTTTLTGSNSYSGVTTISVGTLQVGNGGTSGTLGSGNVVNNSSLIINRSDSASFSNAISGTGGFTQFGIGTTTLSGSSSYSGTTTVARGALSLGGSSSLAGTANVQVTGGSLLIGGNNQINTNAALTMGTVGSATPATLSMGGNGSTRASAQTFATLTLTRNSVIDFANLNGTSSLTFGSISGLSINTLSIWNWSSAAGNATRLFDTQVGGLSTGELANISFYSGGSGSTLLGTGGFSGSEIVPVPEPAVMIASMLLLGWLLFTNRRMLSRLLYVRLR